MDHLSFWGVVDEECVGAVDGFEAVLCDKLLESVEPAFGSDA